MRSSVQQFIELQSSSSSARASVPGEFDNRETFLSSHGRITTAVHRRVPEGSHRRRIERTRETTIGEASGAASAWGDSE